MKKESSAQDLGTSASSPFKRMQADYPLLWTGAFSLAYFAAQVLAFKLPASFGLVAAVWPAAGIALAALLLSPRRRWLALLSCLLAAGLAANLTTSRPLSACLGFMSANICETAAAAWLITRLCGEQIRFARVREVVSLASAVFLINSVTAVIGAATACHTLGSQFLTFYETWWIADALGLFLVTPLVVAWADQQPQWKMIWRGRIVEKACLFALGGMAVWFSFGRETVEGFIEIKPYLLPVFVIWAALRFGTRGTVTLLAVFSVIAIGCTTAGIGPFPLGGNDAPHQLLAVQVFILAVGLSGLMLAASVTQQRESHALLQAVVEGTSDAIYVKDRQGRYLLFNSAAARFVGRSAAEVIGKDDRFLFPLEEAKDVMQTDLSVMGSNATKTYEEHVTGGEGEPLTFLSAKGPFYGEAGEVIGMFGIARDITEHKKTEAYRDMGLKVFQILSEPTGLNESIRSVLAFVKTQTGADAVGLRLQDGEDFPYFVQEGFEKDFLLKENTLVERGPDGGICRNKDGKVCLECTCGLVICGKTDPANPLFTRAGTFWTNDSARLLDLKPEQDPRHRPRNECIHRGYASVALIPIRDKDRIVGLLHLNGRRKGCFSLDTVRILEDLAAHIGAALMRKRVEEALREAQAILQAAMDQSPAGIAIADAPDGKLRYVNDAGLLIRGDTRENVVNGVGIDRYVASWRLMDLDGRPLTSEEVPLARAVMFGETCYREFIVRRNMDDDRFVIANAAPIKNGDGKVVAGIVVFTDITDRKKAEEALLASEERFRRAVMDSPFPILLHAEDGEILQASNSWCEITGYMREELATIGDWTERAYGERKAVVKADIDALYGLNQRKYEGDYTLRTKSGGERVWEFSSAPLGSLPDGRRAVISMAMDVTERRQDEARIASQLEELRRWQNIMLGREDRVRELKREVNAFCARVGEAARYPSQDAAPPASENAQANA